MIDERINKTLKELEQGLINIESARKQVEKTVMSYDSLKRTTSEYVDNLRTITVKVHELVDNVGKDYTQKIKEFEKDRDSILNSSNAAIEKLSATTDEFNESLSKIKTKLNYSLILNVALFIALVLTVFFLIK